MATLEELFSDPFWLTLSIVASASAGLFCAFDARRHGRSPALWFTLGFFLGLVGVVLWLFVRGRAARAQAAEGARCPQCGRSDPTPYGFCMNCGADRPRTPMPAAPAGGGSPVDSQAFAPTASGTFTATCSRCGRGYAPRQSGGTECCPGCELLER